MKMPKDAKSTPKKTFHPFENTFIEQGLDEKDLKNLREDMAAGEEFDKYQYAIDEIQFHENGNYSMVAEQWIEESKTVRSGNTVSTDYRYYDDHVIIVTFKPDGSVAWKQKIVKNQFTHSVMRAYSSFAMISSKNKMYFVFNQFPEGRPLKSKAIMVEVTSDGKLTQEELFSAEEKKLIQPLTFKRTAEKQMCMFGLEKRNYSLAQLTFN
jgi:hypothetical protein